MQFSELAKKFARTDLPGSEVEFTGEIPADDVAPYRAQALAHIAEHAEMPGFRPGKVPQDMVLRKVGEMAVLEEAVDLFVKDFYPEFVETLALNAVGRPSISITKLAPQNPVALTIRTTLYPEVELPKNWKMTGERVALEPSLHATDEEVNQTLESLKESRKAEKIDDEFAKSLGTFESLEALKTGIRKGIGEEKARAARDARRGKIIDALLEKINLEVPRIFVESELDKIMSQLKEDIARMGMKFEDYLTHANKTEEGIRTVFKDQARKRAKLQLTLNAIAGAEKLEPEKAAVDAELKHAMEHFPAASPELVRIHIETVLRNELALKLLEDTGKKE